VSATRLEDSQSFTNVDGDAQVEQAEFQISSQIGSWTYGQPQHMAAEGFNSAYQSGSGQDLRELPHEVLQLPQLPDSISEALDGALIGLPDLAPKVPMPQAQPVLARLAWQNASAGHIAELTASEDTLEDPSFANEHQSLVEMRVKHQPPGRITQKVWNNFPIR
jgi:hypothetical protein